MSASTKTPCIIDGCENFKPREHAMCRTHWRQVPRDLQTPIYRAWRERQRGYDGALERHLQALEDAQAYVERRDPVELFS